MACGLVDLSRMAESLRREKLLPYVEITPDTPISEIEPIEESGGGAGAGFSKRAEIAQFVEPPLRTACEMLWDKNVQTVGSSANKKDLTTGKAYINIDYHSLSDENKKIAEQLGEVSESFSGPVVTVYIPMTEQSTVGEIQAAAEALAAQFHEQPMTWANGMTVQELREMYALDPNDERYQLEHFLKPGFEVDEDSGKLFPAELLQKLRRDRERAKGNPTS